MNFTEQKSIAILERTPVVLNMLLKNLSAEWTFCKEGDDTWNVFDIIGHLIHGEKTDWVVRAEIILSEKKDKRFEPFDRFAQINDNKEKSLDQLLDEFILLRKQNIEQLRSKNLNSQNLEEKGIHPVFGEITLSQLLATWVVHDLNHIAQISSVMAKHYKEEVGPWKTYLKILQ